MRAAVGVGEPRVLEAGERTRVVPGLERGGKQRARPRPAGETLGVEPHADGQLRPRPAIARPLVEHAEARPVVEHVAVAPAARGGPHLDRPGEDLGDAARPGCGTRHSTSESDHETTGASTRSNRPWKVTRESAWVVPKRAPRTATSVPGPGVAPPRSGVSDSTVGGSTPNSVPERPSAVGPRRSTASSPPATVHPAAVPVSATSTVSPTRNTGSPSTTQRASPTTPPRTAKRASSAPAGSTSSTRGRDSVVVEARDRRGDAAGDPDRAQVGTRRKGQGMAWPRSNGEERRAWTEANEWDFDPTRMET